LTAFFNLAEMSLVSPRSSTLASADNEKVAKTVLDLKKRPGLFWQRCARDLIADLLIDAFIVGRIDDIIRTLFGKVRVCEGYASVIAGFGSFVIVSYLTLVFADLVPKSIALSALEHSAMLIASPPRLLIFIACPLLAALDCSNALALDILGVSPRPRSGSLRRRSVEFCPRD